MPKTAFEPSSTSIVPHGNRRPALLVGGAQHFFVRLFRLELLGIFVQPMVVLWLTHTHTKVGVRVCYIKRIVHTVVAKEFVQRNICYIHTYIVSVLIRSQRHFEHLAPLRSKRNLLSSVNSALINFLLTTELHIN